MNIDDIYNQEKIPTRLKIIHCAVNLFAVKGYTETTIRDLANDVGLKGASIYNHFPSKNAILEYIIEDYTKQNSSVYLAKDIYSILRNNPTSKGILDCMQLIFPKDHEEYYLKVLYVLMQEQHRNPIVRKFMTENFILGIEYNVKKIIDVLKELNIVNPDIEEDFWMKISSSLVYTFASRSMLNIGDATPDFTGMGMADMLKAMFDMMLEKHAVSEEKLKQN